MNNEQPTSEGDFYSNKSSSVGSIALSVVKGTLNIEHPILNNQKSKKWRAR
jgi:hypothetical protein